MTVKELKQILEKINEDSKIFIVGYDKESGKTTKKYFQLCCNNEHQEKIKELWVSDEGLPVIN